MVESRFAGIIFTIFLLLISTVYAQFGPKDGAGLNPTELNRVKVGEEAPAFALEDMNGNRITLSDFQNKKNVVLVFYRGHW
jgi:cytochrome oxidase Cu insertion factor (SCO1/SenC/PrrC family)